MRNSFLRGRVYNGNVDTELEGFSSRMILYYQPTLRLSVWYLRMDVAFASAKNCGRGCLAAWLLGPKDIDTPLN